MTSATQPNRLSAEPDLRLYEAVGRARRGIAARALSWPLGAGLLAGGAWAWLGGPLAAAVALPVLATGATLGGLHWRRDALAARAAAWLDAERALLGAVACAWDHRDRAEPIHRAQRRRALAELEASGPWRPARPGPAPLVAAAVGLAGLLVAGLGADTARDRGDATSGPAPQPVSNEATGQPKAQPAAGDPRGPAVAEHASTQRPADPTAANATDDSDPSNRSGGAPDAPAKPDSARTRTRAGQGAGASVGAVAGGAAGARRVAGSPPTRPESPRLALARVSGGAERSAPGVGLPLAPAAITAAADAFADPARPFPTQYHGLIGAWFDREGAR